MIALEERMDALKEKSKIAAISDRRDVRVEAMVARLGRGRKLTTPCTWPGGTLAFDLWVLTQAERDECEASAILEVKNRGIDINTRSPVVLETIYIATAIHVIAAAMRDRETGQRVFATAKMLAEVATDDEIEKLTEMYKEHRVANDPNIHGLSDAEVAAIEDAIKKKDLIRLSSIASEMPKPSLLTLAMLLAASLTGKSSSTSFEPPSPGSD